MLRCMYNISKKMLPVDLTLPYTLRSVLILPGSRVSPALT